MHPPTSETGLNLPAPVGEPLPGLQGGNVENGVQPVEQRQAAVERAPRGALNQTMPTTGFPLPMPVQASPAPAQTDVPATSSQAVPTLGDDDDLIEKEWVNRAKQIVERTRDNPYKQSEELTVVRADYMKKRYNKLIKLSK